MNAQCGGFVFSNMTLQFWRFFLYLDLKIQSPVRSNRMHVFRSLIFIIVSKLNIPSFVLLFFLFLWTVTYIILHRIYVQQKILDYSMQPSTHVLFCIINNVMYKVNWYKRRVSTVIRASDTTVYGVKIIALVPTSSIRLFLPLLCADHLRCPSARCFHVDVNIFHMPVPRFSLSR